MLLILEIALGIVLGYSIIINLDLIFSYLRVIFKYLIISGVLIGIFSTLYYYLEVKQYTTDSNEDLSFSEIIKIGILIILLIHGVVITFGLLGYLLSFFRTKIYSIAFSDCVYAWREGFWEGYKTTWEFLAERCPQGALMLAGTFVSFILLVIIYQIVHQIL